MKYIKASDGIRFQNSKSCVAIEYPFEDGKDINNAVIELNGRYPNKGLSINEVCKEVVYVIEGNGVISSNNIVTYSFSSSIVSRAI